MLFVTLAGLMLLGWMVGSFVNYISDVYPKRDDSLRRCAPSAKPRMIGWIIYC